MAKCKWDGSFYVPHPPPIEKTPLVGVFSIGGNGELLEVSASRKSGRLERSLRAACPERSEEVQYLSVPATKEQSFLHGIKQ